MNLIILITLVLLHVTFPNDYCKSVFYIDNFQCACLLFLPLDISILCCFVKIINSKLYSFLFYFLLLFFFPLILPASISFSIHLFLRPSFLYCVLPFSCLFSPYWVFLTFSMFSFLPPFISPTILFFKFFQFPLYSFIIVLIFFLYYFVPSCFFFLFFPFSIHYIFFRNREKE